MTDAPDNKETRPALPSPWKPDRKLWAGGLGAVIAWALLAACSTWLHYDIGQNFQPAVTQIASALAISPAPSVQGLLAIIIGSGIAYLVPPAYSDVYKRVNDRIIALAVTSDKVDATLHGAVKETAKIEGTTAAVVAAKASQSATTGTGNLY